MVRNDRKQIRNSAKRLPIVFCLDVSPSMGWRIGNNSTSMELLNEAVATFINELKLDPKAKSSAEVAFVTFSTNIEDETDFESVASLGTPKFQPVDEGGTQMAEAVLYAINKIEKRRAELSNMEIPYYAPFLVMLTDGNPDDNDDGALQSKAIAAVRSHCDSHVGASEIIVPFVIGVGDHIDPDTLNRYAAGFTDGYFGIRGQADAVKKVKFQKVFQLIGNSTKVSIHLNGKTSETIRTIQHDMNDLYRLLQGE